MILFEYLAGSHSYDLHNEDSDKDIRGVFLYEDLASLYGLKERKKTESDNKNDIVYWELCHFFQMIQKGNTQALEMLFAPKYLWKNYSDKFVNEVIEKRDSFLDTKIIYSSLLSYSQAEYRKTFNHHGKNGLRNELIDKNGYSHKNAIQCLRLLRMGRQYFNSQQIIVSIKTSAPSLWSLLYDIKNSPSTFSKEWIEEFINDELKLFKEDFEQRDEEKDTVFSIELATQAIKKLYED